jgi:hypothetical protein
MGELEELRKENEKLRLMVEVVRGTIEDWMKEEDYPGRLRRILGLLENVESGSYPTVAKP